MCQHDAHAGHRNEGSGRRSEYHTVSETSEVEMPCSVDLDVIVSARYILKRAPWFSVGKCCYTASGSKLPNMLLVMSTCG